MALDIALRSGAHLVFSTPLLILDKQPEAAEVNNALRDAILDKERTAAGRTLSNVGGWQSNADLLDWPLPAIDTLRRWIEEAVQQMCSLPLQKPVQVEYEAYAWANINREGDYNSVHSHDTAHWALIYYVSKGELHGTRRLNGRLEIRDPRSHASPDKYPGFTFGQGLILDPQPGTLLLFPAWLEHLVHPYYGNPERISIAVNVNMKHAATKASSFTL